MIAMFTHHDYSKTAGHSMRVAEEAKWLARHFGEDETKAEIAGWLHDSCATLNICGSAANLCL
jgi:HD superfamily phosphohydrolase YqeK